MEKEYGKYKFELSNMVRKAKKFLEHSTSKEERKKLPKIITSDCLTGIGLRNTLRSISNTYARGKSEVANELMLSFNMCMMELMFFDEGGLMITPETTYLLEAVSKSTYEKITLDMVKFPATSFIINLPEDFSHFDAVLVRCETAPSYNVKCRQIWERHTRFVPHAKSFDNYMLNGVCNFEHIERRHQNIFLVAIGKNDIAYFDRSGQKMITKILERDEESLDGCWKEPEGCKNNLEAINLLYKTIIGLSMYIQARPDRLIRMADDIVPVYPCDRKIKVRKKKIRELPEMSQDRKNYSRFATWRKGHPRFLWDPRYRRNFDGSIRMIWVNGHMMGVNKVRAEEKVVKA